MEEWYGLGQVENYSYIPGLFDLGGSEKYTVRDGTYVGINRVGVYVSIHLVQCEGGLVC